MGGSGWREIDAPFDAVSQLHRSPLLAAIPAEVLGSWVPALTWWELPGGSTLFEAGDPADAAYFVMSGRIEVHLGDRVLAERGPVDVVGEAGLLAGGTRSASVTAVRDTVVARVEPSHLIDLAAAHPAVAMGLAGEVARRAQSNSDGGTSRVLRAPRLLALVALSAGADIEGLAAVLAGTAPTGTVAVARAEDLVAWSDQGTCGSRLADLELDHDLVLALLPDVGDDPSHVGPAVARQVDLVAAVGRAGEEPSRAMTALLDECPRPVQLVLRRRSGAPPSMSGWRRIGHGAARRQPVIHLADGSMSDLARWSRRLRGTSVGVVFGGGGARGFAHIGALRALQERGVVIDRVGGSSMGAVIGAQVAMGWDAATLLDENRRRWSRRRLIEPTLTGVSLVGARRVATLFEELFGERTIDELQLDFFCTTVDLTDCRLHVADRGPVMHWVGASSSVPGIWPPSIDARGHLHSDGGVLDNVPTSVMAGRSPGPVIAVDVCARQSPMLVRPTPGGDGSLALLRERRGAAPDGLGNAPSLLELLNRSNLLASMQTWAGARAHADLYLTPDTAPHGFASFDRVAELAALGYESVARQLDEGDLSALPV